jgi:hypothetical protein
MNKIKEIILSFFKNLIGNKITFVVKVILYVVSIIVIVKILIFFGFFKQNPVKPPITPGKTTNQTKPSKDSKEVINNIQKQLDFLKGRKNAKI